MFSCIACSRTLRCGAVRFQSSHQQQCGGDPSAFACAQAKREGAIRHVLPPEDLGDARVHNNIRVLSWANEQVLVLLHRDVVRAILVPQPYRAATGRGLRIGGTESQLKDIYTDRPDIQTLPLTLHPEKSGPKATGYIETYRYDELGIGFEIQDKKVTSIVLYPSRSQRDAE